MSLTLKVIARTFRYHYYWKNHKKKNSCRLVVVMICENPISIFRTEFDTLSCKIRHERLRIVYYYTIYIYIYINGRFDKSKVSDDLRSFDLNFLPERYLPSRVRYKV